MNALERLKQIMTAKHLIIEFEPNTDEFYLLDRLHRSYASGKTIEELVESYEQHQ